ncbi:hypothetical protein Aduo_001245 [Ancylostoma duodenale]
MTDKELINEKSRRIAWIVIDEQIDEASTRRFDHEMVKEAVHTSRDEELIHEFEEGRVVSHHHPPGLPTLTNLKVDEPPATNYSASPLGFSQIASSQYSSPNSPNQL